jgi:thioredoxin-dependent peroxiredoxin
MLAIGDTAPDFTLEADDGSSFTLSEAVRDGRVILYFYPKDFTLVCTAQAKMCSNDGARLKRAGIRVVGISHQSAAVHRSFKERYGLNYLLLADEDKRVIRLYGAAKWFGTSRDSYVVGKGPRVLDRARAQLSTGPHKRLIERAIANVGY